MGRELEDGIFADGVGNSKSTLELEYLTTAITTGRIWWYPRILPHSQFTRYKYKICRLLHCHLFSTEHLKYQRPSQHKTVLSAENRGRKGGLNRWCLSRVINDSPDTNRPGSLTLKRHRVDQCSPCGAGATWC